jgi:hypothetical protein
VLRYSAAQPIRGWQNQITLTQDEEKPNVDIGFAFPFYGESYSIITISAHGFVTFGDWFQPGVFGFVPGSGACCPPTTIPALDYGPMIAPLWLDTAGFTVHVNYGPVTPKIYGSTDPYSDTPKSAFGISFEARDSVGTVRAAWRLGLYWDGDFYIVVDTVAADLYTYSIGWQSGVQGVLAHHLLTL